MAQWAKELEDEPDFLDVVLNGEELGRGSYGVVFALGDIAVKIIRDPNRTSEEEVEIGKLAGDLGIGPKIYGTVRDKNGQVFAIMMERLKGETLAIKGGKPEDPITEEDNKMVESLFSQMKKMHRAGIVHNDLHNENVIVQKDNSVRFIDWGFSDLLKGGPNTNRHFQSDIEQFLDPGMGESYLPKIATLSQENETIKNLHRGITRANRAWRDSRMGEPAPDLFGIVYAKIEG
jgi:serine/threonine protein kinase